MAERTWTDAHRESGRQKGMEGKGISLGELEALMQLYKAAKAVRDMYLAPELPFSVVKNKNALLITELGLMIDAVEVLLDW